jgi:hypothetical protein
MDLIKPFGAAGVVFVFSRGVNVDSIRLTPSRATVVRDVLPPLANGRSRRPIVVIELPIMVKNAGGGNLAGDASAAERARRRMTEPPSKAARAIQARATPKKFAAADLVVTNGLLRPPALP